MGYGERAIHATRWNYIPEEGIILVDVKGRVDLKSGTISSKDVGAFDESFLGSVKRHCIVACQIDEATKISGKAWDSWWGKEPIEIISDGIISDGVDSIRGYEKLPNVPIFHVKEILPKSELIFRAAASQEVPISIR